METIKYSSIIWTVEREYLQKIVSESKSLTDVLKILGKNPTTGGSQYKDIQKRLKSEGIDYSHFKLHRLNRMIDLGKSRTKYKEVTDLSLVPRCTLRKYILRNNLIPYVCHQCGLEELWCSKKLTLQLDHIDGNHKNNDLSNLRFLCPNCHSQTDTYGSKNIVKNKKTQRCPMCAVTTKYSRSGFCIKCAGKQKRKIKDRPSLETILNFLKGNSYVEAGKHFGVSNVMVRKWIKGYGVDPPKKRL